MKEPRAQNSTALMTKLIYASLQDLGFPKSAACLLNESKCTSLGCSVAFDRFHHAILMESQKPASTPSKMASLPNLHLLEKLTEISLDTKRAIRCLLYQYDYIDMIVQQDDTESALKCLRQQIYPLFPTSQEKRELNFLLLSKQSQPAFPWYDRDHVDSLPPPRKGGWSFWQHIETLLIPDEMIHPHRLQTLVKRAIESQLDEYTFRKIPSPSIQSLYLHQELLVPLSYNLEQQERLQIATLPRHTLACIETHQDEVWDVKFSPSGNFLASTSKDRLVCIWKMNLDESRNGDAADLYFQINDQAKTPHVLAWAPDEQSLLSCSNETSIMQWDMRFQRHQDTVHAVSWCPDGLHFVSGGLDKRLILWNSADPKKETQVVKGWSGRRIDDLVSQDRGDLDRCFTIEDSRHIYMYQTKSPWARDRVYHQSKDALPIVSFSLSLDGQFLLLNIRGHHHDRRSTRSHLLLLEVSTQVILMKYEGFQQHRYVVRSSFAGPRGEWILSGSENALIYIWKRSTGQLVSTLSGHAGNINTATWTTSSPTNEAQPQMVLASASDDHTIRLWH